MIDIAAKRSDRLGLKAAARRWSRETGALDRAAAAAILPLVLMMLAIIWPVALLAQGRPFLYGAERMMSVDRSFRLWKIRTMHPASNEPQAVMGCLEAERVTPVGRILRRCRLDELPQIFNVLRGEIRFIGPRPPLRRYVEAYPGLYARVLRSPPGITGLSTVMLHRREARILARGHTAQEADALYRRHCIPLKARLDLLYQKRRSPGLDLLILWRTFSRLFR